MINLYFTSSAVELVTKVVDALFDDQEGLFKIKLEKTIFHPRGGGQDNDKGFIDDQEILKFFEGYYYLEKPIEIDKTVLLKVDPLIRHNNARRHSLGHIMGYFVEKKGWIATKAAHYEDDCKVVFKKTPESIDNLDLTVLTAEINGFIRKNIQQSVDIDADNRRAVSFGDVQYLCGGTHVANTAEIGAFILTDMKVKKGMLTVYYQLD